MKRTRLSTAVKMAMGVGTVVSLPISNLALAQDGIEQLEEIVITGSRIENANLASASPVTVLSAEDIAFSGMTRIEDVLGTMPQLYVNQGTGQSNGATGTATLNLRNLGDPRTLVLVNGRRLPSGSPIQGGLGVDINQIPGSLIKSVEVLTGGASAVYGSDAVAGVVNFRMLDDFEGVKLDYQFSQYSHNNDNSRVQGIVTDNGYPVATGTKTDGDINNASLVIGGNFADGRGNVTGYATYRRVAAVRQSERDYSSCALSNDVTTCFGSGTIPEGRVTDFAGGFDFKVAGDQFVPRDGTTFNYGPLNYFQRPDTRYTFGTFAHFDINDHAKVYTELMFMDDRTVSQIAPSGAFFVTNTLECGNPLLSAQQFQQLCGQFGLTAADTQTAYLGRRNVEGGNRRQDLRHTSFRGVFGVEGDINDSWSYNVSYQYGEVSMENTYQNDLGTSKIIRALDAVTDPATGDIVCRSVLNGTDPNCVPWNIFTTGAVTQDQLDYLVLPLFARGTTDQEVISLSVSGDLGEMGVKLPGAESGISLIAGYERREENLDFNPDEGFRNGEGAGQGGATGARSGGFFVNELYVEAAVPILEGKAFAEDLSLGLAYRRSDYSTGNETDTYGIRAGWQIVEDVKLRTSIQRAVRAPNINELFLPQGLNLFDMNQDPCGGATPIATLAECANSGVTAAQYGTIPNSPANQYNFLQGGNTELEPEESDTFSFGVIWTPEMVEGLSLSVDYFQIEIEKGIDNLGPEFILNQCLDGNLSQCANVRRGANGNLWIGSNVNTSGQVVALLDNLAVEEVAGIDVVANYSLEIGNLGSLNFENVLSVITKWDQQELEGAPVVDCKGKWNGDCGFPTPDTQNNLRTTWVTPWNVVASLNWRYISEVEDLSVNEIDLGHRNYFDLAGTWDATENITVRLGMNNIFDQAPPIGGNGAGSGIQGNGGVFPGMYDALGRYMYLGASLQF